MSKKYQYYSPDDADVSAASYLHTIDLRADAFAFARILPIIGFYSAQYKILCKHL